MRITVDGKEQEIESPTISTAIGYIPTPKHPVVLERRTTKDVVIQHTYEVVTNKGVFTVETYKNPYMDFFHANLEIFNNMMLQWTDKNTVNFGIFESPFDTTRKQFDYGSMEVLFGVSGFERTQGILTIAKEGFIGRNGVEKSVFGKVVKGRHVIYELSKGDRIESISQKQVRSEMFDYTLVTSDDVELMDGDGLLSKVIVDLYDSSPYASEHFLFLVRNNRFKIDSTTKVFAKNTTLNGIAIPPESHLARKKGTLSVRVAGKGKGNIYVYYEDAIEDTSHSVFGEVVSGLELIRTVGPGQEVTIEPLVNRINTLGLTQQQAQKTAMDFGIEQTRAGDTADDAIVIAQSPELSVEAKEKGSICTEGVAKDKVFEVELYDDKAPDTAAYFKTITGLKTRELGRLTVFFSHPDLDMILFEGDEKLAGNLSPENPPLAGTKKGKIGITNMASRQRGVIGLRFSDSSEYGPTGEDIDHTNCLGKIENYQGLKGIKEGEIIYILLK